jgi:hypothetical protein
MLRQTLFLGRSVYDRVTSLAARVPDDVVDEYGIQRGHAARLAYNESGNLQLYLDPDDEYAGDFEVTIRSVGDGLGWTIPADVREAEDLDAHCSLDWRETDQGQFSIRTRA